MNKIIMIGLFLAGISCTNKLEEKEVTSLPVPEIQEEPKLEPTQESLVERGKKVYQKNCMSCHTSNPLKNGPMCPSNAFSSEELLRLKVLEGKYPNGYKPKKPTKVMPKFPHLKEDIKALHEYLNSFDRK
jgi:mono/diheme cytochrome c family protein